MHKKCPKRFISVKMKFLRLLIFFLKTFVKTQSYVHTDEKYHRDYINMEMRRPAYQQDFVE